MRLLTLHATLSAAEEKGQVPAPPWVLGVIAFAILVALLVVTLTFNRDR